MKYIFMVVLGVIVMGAGCSIDLKPLTALLQPTTSTTHTANEQRCFKNIGLRETYHIKWYAIAPSIQGVFIIDNNMDPVLEYPFTGTKNNSEVSIVFKNNQLPEIIGDQKNIIWKLTDGEKSLEATIYGQDYATKKYSFYDIPFESYPCPTSALE
jgi:hypothetical protein